MGPLTSRGSTTPELRVQSRCGDQDTGVAGQRGSSPQSSLCSDGSRSHGDLAARDLKSSPSQAREGDCWGTGRLTGPSPGP